jgi:pyruvate-formate lyase-activating enzyme
MGGADNMNWQGILKNDKSVLKIKQIQAMLRMLVPEHGKDSKEVQELGRKFMATNPTEEEIDEVMEYFEKLEEKPKPRTPMDELREKQKRAKEELDSKRDR